MKNKGLVIVAVVLALIVGVEAYFIFFHNGLGLGRSPEAGVPVASTQLLSAEQMNTELEQNNKDRAIIEDLDTSAKRINKDYEEKNISEGQAVLLMLQAGLEPEKLPSKYQATHNFMPNMLDPLAGAISLANANIAKYDTDVAEQIKQLLNKRPELGRQVGLSASLAQLEQPGGKLETIEDENFIVHYVSGDVQLAQVILRALQDSMTTAPKYGFPVQASDAACSDPGTDGRLDVYLVSDKISPAGEFLPCLGTNSGFIKIASDLQFESNFKKDEKFPSTDYEADYQPADDSLYRVITAHAYFHAVQLAMVGATSYITPWVGESTANLFAIRLVDQIPFNISNDAGHLYRELINIFQGAPQQSLETPPDHALWMDFGPYARLLFMIYAEERGKIDEVKQLIEAQLTPPIEDIFGGANAFMSFMEDFAQANLLTHGLQPQQYREAALYPGVDIDTVVNEYDVENQEVGSIEHLASKYVALNITPDIADEPEMEIEFDGDDNGRFRAQAFVMKENTAEIVPIELDGAGKGKITVDLDGVSIIFLAGTATTVTPGTYSYRFSARLKALEQTYKINGTPFHIPGSGVTVPAEEFQETWKLKKSDKGSDGSKTVKIKTINTKGEKFDISSVIKADGSIIFERIILADTDGNGVSCDGPFTIYTDAETSESVSISCRLGLSGPPLFTILGTVVTGPPKAYSFDGETYQARTTSLAGTYNGQPLNQNMEWVVAPGIGVLEMHSSFAAFISSQLTGGAFSGTYSFGGDFNQVLTKSDTETFWQPAK